MGKSWKSAGTGAGGRTVECLLTGQEVTKRQSLDVTSMTVDGVSLGEGRIARNCITDMDRLSICIAAQERGYALQVQAELDRVSDLNAAEKEKEAWSKGERAKAIAAKAKYIPEYYTAQRHRAQFIPVPVINIPAWLLTEEAREGLEGKERLIQAS